MTNARVYVFLRFIPSGWARALRKLRTPLGTRDLCYAPCRSHGTRAYVPHTYSHLCKHARATTLSHIPLGANFFADEHTKTQQMDLNVSSKSIHRGAPPPSYKLFYSTICLPTSRRRSVLTNFANNTY